MPAIVVQPVVLCGGRGTRLWPLSRAEFPKQFLSLFGRESLFQLAIERLQSLRVNNNIAAPLIIGNEEHRLLIMDQLRDIDAKPQSILLEPAGRNTAPAVTLAAHVVQKEKKDPVLVVCPADQIVLDNAAFANAVAQAILLAEKGAIVTLGIVPDRPETGYGYIGVNKKTGRVHAFTEKPDHQTAVRYVKQGYYWNSGIFVLKASVWQKAIETFRPDIAKTVEKAWQARQQDALFVFPDREYFKAAPSESIDYAVMEKAVVAFDVRMVLLAAGWSDLGSWEALWQRAKKDSHGNSFAGDVTVKNSNNVFVHATGRHVTIAGVDNITVIETPDAVLVTGRNQEIKAPVKVINNKK